MLMRFYEAIGIPAGDMRLLINLMGCEKCRPAYRELVRQYIHEHEADMCDECNHRAEINPLRAFDCKIATCAEIMEVHLVSLITCVTIVANTTKP